jgi:hypothetical protein
MSPYHGAVEHLNQMGGFARLRQHLEKCFEHAGSAEPPEPLPDAVPLSEFRWQSPPRDVVHREIVQGPQKLTVVVGNRGKSVGARFFRRSGFDL